MKIEEILEHNEKIVSEYQKLGKQRAALEYAMNALQAKLIAPCESCPFDGVYRCEACAEAMYAGYNKRDFLDPHMEEEEDTFGL
jgi:hypothetical protein